MFNRDRACADKYTLPDALCLNLKGADGRGRKSLAPSGKRWHRGSVMDYYIEEIQPDVWRVEVAGTSRIIRRGQDTMTFAPWDILSGDGHRLWASPSLESAFRWIQARTGLPAEALLSEGLLSQAENHADLTRDTSEALHDTDQSVGNTEAIGR